MIFAALNVVTVYVPSGPRPPNPVGASIVLAALTLLSLGLLLRPDRFVAARIAQLEWNLQRVRRPGALLYYRIVGAAGFAFALAMLFLLIKS